MRVSEDDVLENVVAWRYVIECGDYTEDRGVWVRGLRA